MINPPSNGSINGIGILFGMKDKHSFPSDRLYPRKIALRLLDMLAAR
jgi:hypothetical protein